MTVREYIGARYVPLFMGDWDVNEDYEPLSIVQYQGNSYTSRQSVPHGVEITNTAYWAITGNYNAQVEAYRQEVRTLDNTVSGISDDVTDLTNDLAAETAARGNADTALGTRITNETTARENADTALGTRITNETTARENADTAIESELANIQYLDGKNALIYGDSTVVSGGSYFEYVKNITGMTYTNRGISGTKVTPDTRWTPDSSQNDLWNLLKRASASDFAGFDYVFLCYNTNEWAGSTNIFDCGYNSLARGNYERALKESIEMLISFNPTMRIVFVAPAFGHKAFYSSIPNVNGSGYQLKDYAEMSRRIMYDYNCGFIDLSNLGVNESNYTNWLENDSGGIYVHYKDNLKRKAAEYIAASYPWSVDEREKADESYNLIELTGSAIDQSSLNSLYNTFFPYDSNMVPVNARALTPGESVKTIDEFYIDDECYINFWLSSFANTDRLKIYAENEPSNYIILNNALSYGRCSVKIPPSWTHDRIVFENLSASATMRIYNVCIAKSPFGYNKKLVKHENLDITWKTDEVSKDYFMSSVNDEMTLVVISGTVLEDRTATSVIVVGTLPSALIPARTVSVPACIDSSGTFHVGMARINANGQILFEALSNIPANSSFSITCPYVSLSNISA